MYYIWLETAILIIGFGISTQNMNNKGDNVNK